MATTEALKTITMIAAADLSALQFTFVVGNSAGKCAAAGAGANVAGILMSKAVADQGATVGVGGVAKVKAGAAFAANAKLMSDATGRAITATATNHVACEAMEAATAPGEIVSVRIAEGPKFILAA